MQRGTGICVVAEAFGTNRSTLHRWIQRYQWENEADREDFKKDRANFAKLMAVALRTGNEIIRRLDNIQHTLRIQGNGRKNR
ncbi:MAG: hypothetical protein HY716_12220 [Planctomycetes bacterium]|nr:hypothetical protein [Planctomycetota bacterium]